MSNSWFADTNTNKVHLLTTWFYESNRKYCYFAKSYESRFSTKKKYVPAFEASTFDVNLKKKDSKKKKIRVILFYSKKKDLVIIRLVGGMGLAFLV